MGRRPNGPPSSSRGPVRTGPGLVPWGRGPCAGWPHSGRVRLAAGAEAAEAKAERAGQADLAAREALDLAARTAERCRRRATLLGRQAELASAEAQAEAL